MDVSEYMEYELKRALTHLKEGRIVTSANIIKTVARDINEWDENGTTIQYGDAYIIKRII